MSMMISVPQYVRDSIITSRNTQEAMALHDASELTAYGQIANQLAGYTPLLDGTATMVSHLVAQNLNKQLLQSEYEDPKNGKLTNWIHRNVIMDPMMAGFSEKERSTLVAIGEKGSEYLMQTALRLIRGKLEQMGQKKLCQQMYSVLCHYDKTGPAGGDPTRTAVEMRKFLDTASSLTNREKKSIKNASVGIEETPIADLDLSFSKGTSVDLTDGLAAWLFELSANKYCDQYNRDDVKKHLLYYYLLLGDTYTEAEERYQANLEAYSKRAADQQDGLRLGRRLLSEVFVKMPDMPSIDGIKTRAEEIAKWDPYAVRREKTAATGKKAVRVVQQGVNTLADLYDCEPLKVVNAVSTAVSQIAMSDDTKDGVLNYLCNKGIDENSATKMLEQGEANANHTLEAFDETDN